VNWKHGRLGETAALDGLRVWAGRLFSGSATAGLPEVAEGRLHDILMLVSQPLVRMPADGWRFFPFDLGLSQRFSFQQITKRFRSEHF
jgi:hypothetical protein